MYFEKQHAFQIKGTTNSLQYMKKLYILNFYCIFLITSIYSQTNSIESSLLKLDLAIQSKKIFDKQKLIRIAQIKSEGMKIRSNDLEKQYQLKERIYNEYRSFSYDSAFKYVMELNKVANRMHDVQKISAAKIKMGFTLLSSGLFKEAIDTLNSIDVNMLSTPIRSEYYSTLGRTYHDLALYDDSPHFSILYNKVGNQLLEKSIALKRFNSVQYLIFKGLAQLKAGLLEDSRVTFEKLKAMKNVSEHDRAIATSSLGHIYARLNNKDKAIELFSIAAIYDIESSTKEAVALRNLANLLHERGDVLEAYKYIKIAMEDAEYYNARHRKMEVGNILPIIEGEYLNIIEKQKEKLYFSVISISILVVLGIILLIISMTQYYRLRKVKDLLLETNSSLTITNKKLLEANSIKEKYIGYYFNVNSIYIDRIEKIQKALNRKIVSRQFDDMQEFLRKDLHLEQDREDLNHNFDKIFISIFPNFVTEFNKMFETEDQIILKDNQLLNNELRIFALIRMGISDNEKIAKILNYSVNTIYTYKTKIKNRSKIHNDDFEEFIMHIDA